MAEAIERDDGVESELQELRTYHRQMEAMWGMMRVVLETLHQDMYIKVGSDHLEVCCPTCVRVVGILEASAAIMRRTSSLG